MIGIIAFLLVLTFSDASIRWSVKDYEPYEMMAYLDILKMSIVVFPSIKILNNNDTKICNFTLYPSDNKELTVVTIAENEGMLKVSQDAKKPTVKQLNGTQILIQASTCNQPITKSTKRPIFIHVIDKENEPFWEHPITHVTILRSLDRDVWLTKLTALPPTLSSAKPATANIIPSNHSMEETAEVVDVIEASICNYTLIRPIQFPYSIRENGDLLTKTPIEHKPGVTHSLQVQATVCGNPDRLSTPATLLITYCSPYWSMIPQGLNYSLLTGRLSLMPKATFENCSLNRDDANEGKLVTTPIGCLQNRTVAFVQLEETYREKDKNQLLCPVGAKSVLGKLELCGMHLKECEFEGLFPEYAPKDLSVLEDGPYFIPDGIASHVLRFNGHSSKINVELQLNKTTSSKLQQKHQFTLAFWIRRSITFLNHSPQETIFQRTMMLGGTVQLFSVSLKDKKLRIFLVENGTTSHLWIFNASDVMKDDNWHQITVLVQPSTIDDKSKHGTLEVELFMDSSEVFKDEGPITDANHITVHLNETVSTQTIGAEWSFSENRFEHHFKGDLVGMLLLQGCAASLRVIRCFLDCRTRLGLESGTFRGITPGTRITWESPFTHILIESDHSEEVVTLVRRLKVFNLESQFFQHQEQPFVRITSHITRPKSSNTTQSCAASKDIINAPQVIIPIVRVSLPESEKPPPLLAVEQKSHSENAVILENDDDDTSCGYQLKISSDSVAEMDHMSRPVSSSVASDGFYMIPDANLTWEAISSQCMEDLHNHEANVLGCGLDTCDPLTEDIGGGEEEIKLIYIPPRALQSLGVTTELTTMGFSISGKAATSVYQDLIRHIFWSYSRLDIFQGRSFKRCFSMQCTATVQDNHRRIITFHRSNQIEIKIAIPLDDDNISEIELSDLNIGVKSSEEDSGALLMGRSLPIVSQEEFQKNIMHTPAYWAAIAILAVGVVVVVIGLVYVRLQSVRRRSPHYLHKLMTRSAFVAANPHCLDLNAADGSEWIPVVRRRQPTTLNIEGSDNAGGRRVHFIVNPLLATEFEDEQEYDVEGNCEEEEEEEEQEDTGAVENLINLDSAAVPPLPIQE